METSEDGEPADTLPVDVAIARYLAAWGTRIPRRAAPPPPTETQLTLQASTRVCTLARAHLAAGCSTAQRYLWHAQFSRWHLDE